MAADARRAVRRLPDVREVTIRLNDHYTGREINDAINRGDGFMGAFPGETADDELTSLRELFLRKSLVGRQSRLCEALLADGCTPADIASKRVAELPDDPNARRCLELRRQLGLADAPESPAFVLPSGEPVVAAELTRWLRTARLMRIESRGERRHLPLAAARSPRRGDRRPRGGPDMKAARLHAYQEPLKLDEVDEPKALGPLDVVVRIGAAGLCRTDLHIQEGQWAEKSGVKLPYTPGPRERRLGPRGRLGGHQRRSGATP